MSPAVQLPHLLAALFVVAALAPLLGVAFEGFGTRDVAGLAVALSLLDALVAVTLVDLGVTEPPLADLTMGVLFCCAHVTSHIPRNASTSNAPPTSHSAP